MAKVFGQEWTRAELARRVGRLEQVAGVRLVTLGDGAERGVRALEFRTGSGFSFEVLVDRAFDIGRCAFRGVPLAWESSTGFVGPWYREPQDLGFLRTFGGGLLTTCGLDHAHTPAVDTTATFRYPRKETESYGLHGRIGTVPARLVGYGERWSGDDCILWASGETQQSAVFGENLVLRRTIETTLGESHLRIADEVVNVGFHETPHMLLYHVNVGWPIVDEGAKLAVPGGAAREWPETLEAPGEGYVEQIHELDFSDRPDEPIRVGIVNESLDLGMYETFRPSQLGHLVVWRMLGEGTYVVGVEPATNSAAGRIAAREHGDLITLEPGEARRYDLELGVYRPGEQGLS